MARAALAGLLLCVLALTGCAALADIGELRGDLESAGYDATNINHHTTNGVTVLSIDVTVLDDEPTDEATEHVAEIAWTKYPREIDRLEVSVNGRPLLAEDYDALVERFGERPEGMPAGGGNSTVTVLLVVGGVAVVFVALMVLVWRRGRRPPPPVAPPPGYQPGGYYQYPPRPPQG